VQSLKLPAWQLTAANPAGLVVTVPRWILTAGPLTAATAASAAALRPDHPPPRVAREPRVIALDASLAALGLTVGAWLAWWAWQTRRVAAGMPFARAWRDIRGIDARDPMAWQALHRAFDETAGRVIQPATLPALFESAPHLAELRGSIDDFFRESSGLFFGGTAAAGAVSLHELCARLRRIERRYAP
jgi:mxaA protein